jgi:hypothetical protein
MKKKKIPIHAGLGTVQPRGRITSRQKAKRKIYDPGRS